MGGVNLMSQEWFVSKEGRRDGPYSFTQLRRMFREGSLDPTDMVWSEGMAQWMQAGQVPGLVDADAALPPLTPRLEDLPGPKKQKNKGGKGLQIVLVVFLLGIIALGALVALLIFSTGRGGKSLPQTASNEEEVIFSPTGYWTGKIRGSLIFLNIEPADNVTIVLPAFGELFEGRYRHAGQEGRYLMELYRAGENSWSEMAIFEVVDEETLQIVHGGDVAVDPFTRVSAEEFQLMLSNMTTREPYLAYRAESHANFQAAFMLVENLITNPLNSADWERDLKVSLALLIVICEDILTSSAPEQYKESHDHLQWAANHYIVAVDEIINGNTGEARQLLASGDYYYREANRLLQETGRTGP